MAAPEILRCDCHALESRLLLAGDMRAGVDQGLLSVVGDEAVPALDEVEASN